MVGGEEEEEALILVVKDWKAIAHCRICHESEFESSKTLEAPCACSGTVKFAHRDCIQRWCDEKGNTLCELCLQKYEPSYRVPPPKDHEAALTVRDDYIVENQESEGGFADETTFSECNSAAVTTIFRLLALLATVILLLRHLCSLFKTQTTQSQQQYPFTFLTLLLVKVSGIVIPMYMLVQTITAIQRSIQKSARHRHQQYYDPDHDSSNSGEAIRRHRVV